MRLHPLSVLFVLAFGPLNGLATPFASHWDDLRQKHTWNSVSENWQNLVPAIQILTCPAVPGRHGAHLSREEVAELVAPPSDVLELANAWLAHHGMHPSTISIKHGGSWLTLTSVPEPRANELLSASYQLYQHIGANDTVLRTLSYGLPAALVEHVQCVAPTTHFGFPRMLWQEPLMRRSGASTEQTKVPRGDPRTVLSSRDQDVTISVTPSSLRTFYKTSGYVPLAAGWNILGAAGYLSDYPSPDDLGQFMNKWVTSHKPTSYIFLS
ncbi:Pro-kumamolisin, activation domain-containing protein [Lactarius sanguifluus]|nr:Pro-kumamolisin, activation domain-containing protein [Lactarius sanguifluus]